MILLAIPLGLLGAIGFLVLRNMDLDVYGQIGLVMLIGLVAKNSILIVQFAKDLHDQGKGIVEAAMEAARIRLRPILMTAFAFILGLMPLVLASGAGANSRRSLGTAVVGGLTLATVLIVFVPIFYVVIERMRERKAGAAGKCFQHRITGQLSLKQVITMHTVKNRYFMKAAVLIAACGLLIGLAGCEKPKQKAKMPPPSVVVSEVKQETVPIVMQVAGTVQPVKTVQIVPRVSGYIFERNFIEGTNVTEGDPLYLIDPRPYQAKLDSLKAQLEQHQASLKFWSSEAARYTRLAKQGAGSVEDKEKADRQESRSQGINR